jgi:hypothetical protein
MSAPPKKDNYRAQLIKPDEEEEEDDFEEQDDILERDVKYPPITYYVWFCIFVSCQALGFGATVSFTGPTMDSISKDLNLCGMVYVLCLLIQSQKN